MFIRRVLALMLGLMLMTSTAAAVAAEPAITRGDEQPGMLEVAVDHPHMFARLEIGNGSELVFYVMLANGDDEDDERRDQLKIADPDRDSRRDIVRGIGVMQHVPVGGMDPITVPDLRGANPHEIFYAFSKPDTDVPGVLRELHGNRFKRQPQGWALGKVKPSVYQKLFTCENTEPIVANAVATTGLPYSYNELSQGPHNNAFWYVQDPNALFPTYYTNNGVVTTGDAYYHVMLCEEDPAFSFTSVEVRLAYTETSGDDKLSSGQLYWKLNNPGDQMSFMSWPFDSDLSGDNSWFWMMTVEDVFYHDTLHIGTAWS